MLDSCETGYCDVWYGMVSLTKRQTELYRGHIEYRAARQEENRKTAENIPGYSDSGHADGWCEIPRNRLRRRQMICGSHLKGAAERRSVYLLQSVRHLVRYCERIFSNMGRVLRTYTILPSMDLAGSFIFTFSLPKSIVVAHRAQYMKIVSLLEFLGRLVKTEANASMKKINLFHRRLL